MRITRKHKKLSRLAFKALLDGIFEDILQGLDKYHDPLFGSNIMRFD